MVPFRVSGHCCAFLLCFFVFSKAGARLPCVFLVFFVWCFEGASVWQIILIALIHRRPNEPKTSSYEGFLDDY